MENTKVLAGKKVLIILENLPVPFDTRVWNEAKALRDKGMMVTVICPTGKGYKKKYEVIDGIHIYRHTLPFEAKSSPGYLIEYAAGLFWEFVLSFKIFISRGFDVIHACNPPDLIFLIGLFYKMFKKKFVFDHHDLCPELYSAKFNRKDFFYKLMFLLEKLTFKVSDISIATNNSYKEVAIKRGGMPPEKVFVVRSGPDFNRLKIMPPEKKYKCGRKYLVGYVGVIGKQEGLEYLVDACKYIVKEKNREDIHFICVGGGTDLENIKNYAAQEGVSGFFTFTGRVSDDILLKALNTADICVNPDIYNDMNNKSTMNKIMEYMALKKPVIQSDLKEGKESAQEASLYAKPNDPIDFGEKILELINDEAKRKEMGEIGYKRVKEILAWDHQKEHLYKAYRKLFRK
jgi:glycosyltransferase involved in cell wall biosynthesis